MTGWLAQHGRTARDALQRLLRQPLSTLFNVVVMGVTLALPAGLYTAVANLQTFSRQISPDPQISVFMDLEAARDDIAAVEQRLRQNEDVARHHFIPRERALDELRRNAGLGDVLDSLKSNPLPDAFVVTVKGSDPERLERLRDEAARWPRVAHAQLDSEWARKLDAGLRLGRTLAWLMGVLLGAALVAVTFNTIRLQILTRHEEIEVSRLIGATNAFIRRPFLYVGTAQGLAGGAAAWAIVAASLWVLNRDLTLLGTLYGAQLQLQPLSPTDSVLLLALAAGLGWLGAWLSVARYLLQDPVG